MSQTRACSLPKKAPRAGSAPRPGLGRSPVMLHRPRRSQLCPRAGADRARSAGAGRPECATDAAGAQDAAWLPLWSRAKPGCRRSCPDGKPRNRHFLDGAGPEAAGLLRRMPVARALRVMRLWSPGWGLPKGCLWGLQGGFLLDRSPSQS
ncbi:uncharacterized protein [Equus asinus]|uniref:uncharacterized protein n=1 Tax=Equus asinus TaxID=9793 RepID=UPI00071A87C7|nr:uncharacterized protein LOC106825746 isoform X1 [Equus asinus]XP_046532567.1 uncharacterized protein LOC124247396 isoform X1 [Equus quagga]